MKFLMVPIEGEIKYKIFEADTVNSFVGLENFLSNMIRS
jgi:hypothetical protein